MMMMSWMRMGSMVVMMVVNGSGNGRWGVWLRIRREAEHVEWAGSVVDDIVVVMVVVMRMNMVMVVMSRRIVDLCPFGTTLVVGRFHPVDKSVVIFREMTISLYSS